MPGFLKAWHFCFGPVAVPHHVVILGCGRSGTSIFGELFEHLPDYRYYSEPPLASLATLDYSAPVAMKVPRESEGFHCSPGLSFPLDTLLAIIPAPRTIYWQLRHPLDTICSLRVQNTNNGQFVEAKTSRAYSRTDHTVRVERWRENLSKVRKFPFILWPPTVVATPALSAASLPG